MSLLAILASRGKTTANKKKATSRINTAAMILGLFVTVVNVTITGLNSSTRSTLTDCR